MSKTDSFAQVPINDAAQLKEIYNFVRKKLSSEKTQDAIPMKKEPDVLDIADLCLAAGVKCVVRIEYNEADLKAPLKEEKKEVVEAKKEEAPVKKTEDDDLPF